MTVRRRPDVGGRLGSRGRRWRVGSRRAMIWGLADVVFGGRNHHSLFMREIMRVSLRPGMYLVFCCPHRCGFKEVAYKNVK